jgi:N,N'-diacetyllegionaminate synthase
MSSLNPHCLIIAEAGVNHNGNIDTALRLVEAAAVAGADIVKFQSFKADLLVTKSAPTAEYQKNHTGFENQYQMLKDLELQDEHLAQIYECCKDNNIEFMSTPFDIESARFLMELGMDKIKVPSGELTNVQLIADLSSFNREMIVSTGMSTLQEIKNAINTINRVRNTNFFTEPIEDKLSLLHCTSNYPACLDDINLRALQTLQMETGLPVGYSDHSEGYTVSISAVALGATILEKHFTLDKSMDGPDHQASLEPSELNKMVIAIREVERALGSSEKNICDSERAVKNVVRKSVTLATSKKAGETLAINDVVLLRPGTGIPPEDIDKVIGKKLTRALSGGTTLNWRDLCE